MDVSLFVHNVEEICKIKNTYPTIACRESGVGSSFLSDIKRGRIPSVDKFQLLAQYLGVSTSQLLGEGYVNQTTGTVMPQEKKASPPEGELAKLLQEPLMEEIYEAAKQLSPEARKIILAQIRAVKALESDANK